MKIVIGDKKPRNVHGVAKLCNANLDRVQMASSLFGVVPDSVTLEEAKAERRGRVFTKRNEKEEGEEA